MFVSIQIFKIGVFCSVEVYLIFAPEKYFVVLEDFLINSGLVTKFLQIIMISRPLLYPQCKFAFFPVLIKHRAMRFAGLCHFDRPSHPHPPTEKSILSSLCMTGWGTEKSRCLPIPAHAFPPRSTSNFANWIKGKKILRKISSRSVLKYIESCSLHVFHNAVTSSATVFTHTVKVYFDLLTKDFTVQEGTYECQRHV